jgi:hypothetical protein
MSIRYTKYITRGMVRAEPATLFVFGDNMRRWGMGGQAKEMRGEPNVVGIPTKWHPSSKPDSFFRDDNLDDIRAEIDEAFGRLVMHISLGGSVVWPTDGIGTGLAELPTRAPLIWEYIETGRKALEKLAAPVPLPQEPGDQSMASPGAGRPASR